MITDSRFFGLAMAAFSAGTLVLSLSEVRAAGSPDGIGDISWNLATAQHKAKGCDLWQTTWAADGSLRTGWGDCVGPPPAPSAKLGTMHAKIVGSAANHTVSSIDTGTVGTYDGYRTTGLDSIGLGHKGWKPASFLYVDGKLWAWSFGGGDDSCTRSRLKSSTNYDAAHPTFAWADWTLSAVGYASFVQYGKAYSGGPVDYVYAVIPMSGPSQVSNNCLAGVSHFGLLRGERGSLGDESIWQYFTGMKDGDPTWVSVSLAGAATLAEPIFSSPTGLKYPARGSMTYNAGKGLFFLSMPWLPPGCDQNRGRFCAGLEVWSAPTPWGPKWELRFRSDTTWPGGTTTCGKGTATNRGAGEEAHFPPKWMSADGRTMHLISSTADCLTVIEATIP